MLELNTDPWFDLSQSGLRHGDGLFETIRVEGGRPRLMDRHLARMAAGLAFLRMPPLPPIEDLDRCIRVLLARSAGAEASDSDPAGRAARGRLGAGLAEGALRLIAADGRLTLLFQPLPLDFPVPVRLTVSRRVTRNRHNTLSAFKTLSYLENLLLVREAEAAGAFDAVALNENGELTDGGRTNLFVVTGRRVLTPPASSGCLPGVARSVLVEAGLAAEQALSPAALLGAEAVFLTNALRGVVPVVSLLPDAPSGTPCAFPPDHPVIGQAHQTLRGAAESQP